ncbi:hypothetical protein E4U41_002850 [Claviceps citrina]|nr:hypothetical protein E4U41_002850 [Claviceps citrina]
MRHGSTRALHALQSLHATSPSSYRSTQPLVLLRKWTHSSGGSPGGGGSTLRILEHVHLRGHDDDAPGPIPYSQAEAAQEQHRSRLLSWKTLSVEERAARPADEPKPRLLSFEAEPTFTLGRRQDSLSAEQTARLASPLRVAGRAQNNRPQISKTNRGGLTTYHGPGQLVLWPVLDMRSCSYPVYGVASYAHHLEATTQRLLLERFGIRTCVSRDEPGVWVPVVGGGQPPRKIAALGVHHRRYVTALGIAINVDVPVAGGQDVNPWARFVPCGLEGKLVTSVTAELGGGASTGCDLEELARRWAVLFEEGMLDEAKRGGGSSEAQDRLRR